MKKPFSNALVKDLIPIFRIAYIFHVKVLSTKSSSIASICMKMGRGCLSVVEYRVQDGLMKSHAII